MHFNSESLTTLLAAVQKGSIGITDCAGLQDIQMDLKAHYRLQNDIDCSATKDWDKDECASLNDEDACNANETGCAWHVRSFCEGEMYVGCAYGDFDCIEWCGGTDWIEKDLCVDEFGFKPIGTHQEPFEGVFDGAGHTIAKLTIQRFEKNYVGLFGVVKKGIIENVRLKYANIEGNTYVGGIVGSLTEGRVKDVFIENVKVIGEHGVGGIVGESTYGNGKSAIIRSAVYQCEVLGNSDVGGIVGENNKSLMSVLSSSECFVSGGYDVGGMVGHNKGGELIDVFTDAEASGDVCVAGIVGTNEGRGVITNALAVGKVICDDCRGENVGGLVGRNAGDGVIIKSFYIEPDSGQNDASKGKLISTEEASIQSTFSGWDFAETWFMNNPYPYLKVIASPEEILSAIHGVAKDEDEETEYNVQEEEKQVTDSEAQNASIVSGTVYVSTKQTDKGKAGMDVAATVNSGAVVVRSKTNENGEYSLEVPHVSTGDLLAVILENGKIKSITIVRATDKNLKKVNLYYDKLALFGGSGSETYTTSEILSATENGGKEHPDIEGLFNRDGKNITLQERMSVYIPSNSTLKMKGDLETEGLELRGTLQQKSNDLTVRGDYLQRSGTFKAGKGTTKFNANVTINGGTFEGSEGTVELNDDFIGIFKLKGGEFIAPKLLIVRTQWEQKGGEFTHNEGTVELSGTSHHLKFSDDETFFNLRIAKANKSRAVFPEGKHISVLRELELNDGEIRGGSILVFDDLKVSPAFDGGNTHVKITGSGERVITLSAGAKYPSMEINSSNVSVTLSSENGKSVSTDSEVTLFDQPLKILNGQLEITDTNVLFHGAYDMQGGTLNVNGGKVAFDEPIMVEGGTLRAKKGELTFSQSFSLNGGKVKGSNAQLIFKDDVTIKKGTFSGGDGDIKIKGALILEEGKFTAPTSLLTLSGNLEQKSGEFKHNDGTVILRGKESTVNVNDLKFNDLIVAKSEGISAGNSSGSINVKGDLLFEKGVINGPDFMVSGNVSMGPEFSTGAINLSFIEDKHQTLAMEFPERFQGSIVVNKREGTNLELLSKFPLTISGQSVEVHKGSLDLNGYGMIFSGATLPLVVKGGGKLLIRGHEKIPKMDLHVNSTVEYNLKEGPVRLAKADYHHLVLNSDRGMRMLVPEGGLTVRGDISIRGGTLEDDKNTEIRLHGFWLHSGGEFIPGVGTLVFMGDRSYIEGNNTFFNLKKAASANANILVVESETLQRINGNLELTGSGCNLLRVRSTDPLESWNLQVLGSTMLRSVDVSGLNYLGNILVCTEECIDRDDNDQFEFMFQYCTRPSAFCGDGVIESNRETCDDGNLVPRDGCTTLCNVELGFDCREEPSVCTAVCGNDKVQGHETCDDGNTEDGDGCSHICFEEKGYECFGTPGACRRFVVTD
ncbi:DUF4215 domain-containing protein [Patescibacteria group bacterium]|nr:DUF4215 domain-containing protein [Patescibacteria group bacterium]